MTIGAASQIRASFACNGVSTVFPVPIQAYQAADFLVILTAPGSAGGAQVPLVLNSDYSMVASSTDAPPKWTLTTLGVTPYATGYTLQIIINDVLDQETQYVEGQAFPSLAVQTNFDRLTQMAQRLADQVGRCIHVPDGDVAPLMLLPVASQRALMNIGTDAQGNVVVNQQLLSGTLSQASIGAFLWPPSAGEIGSGHMPVDKSKYYDDPARHGAVLNGIADDTAAFVAISAALAYGGGGVVNFYGTPLFNSASITIPKNVTWSGPQSNPGIDFDTNNTGTYFKSGTIVLNGAYTLNLDTSACIRRCTIMEKNLSPTGTYPLPVTLLATAQAMIAAYHGIALTQIAADTRAEDILILGFAQAYYSTGNERTYIRRMYGDNIAGIWIDQSTDIARIADCHMWPFPIAHKAFSSSVWERTGAAYKMTNHFDGGMLSRCFEWAYDVGFDMQSNNSIHMTDCSCDSGSLGIGQIGFKFTGNSELVQLVDCKASGQDTGLYVNVAATSSIGAIDVIGGAYFGNFAHFVSDNHRTMTFLGTHFRDTNGGSRTAVTLNAGVTGTTNIGQCTFESMNHAYAIAAGVPAENCRRWNNTYKVATGDTLEDRKLADGTNDRSTIHTVYNAGINGWAQQFRHASGSVAAPGISPVNANPWSCTAYVYDSAVFSPLGSVRIATHGAAPAAGNTPGAVIFATNRSSGVLTDTLVIGEDGFTFPAVDNSVKCGKSGLRWSEVWAANGAIQTSDERAKTDVRESTLGLEFINALRPVSYRWKVGGNVVAKTGEQGEVLETEALPGKRTHWGLIAQDVQRAVQAAGVEDFAGWVLEDKDNPDSAQSLRYDQFIAPLIKAVQELSARVHQLEGAVSP